MKTIGIILIVVGLALSVFTGFKYFTKEKVVDIGKIEITKDKPHRVDWSPIAGLAILVSGGVLVFVGAKKGS